MSQPVGKRRQQRKAGRQRRHRTPLEIDYDFKQGETDEIKSGIILTEYLGEESSIKLPSEMSDCQ